MLKIITIIATLLPSLAMAQTGVPVKQSGNITPNHPMMWVAPGIAADAGTAANGFLSSLGVTASGPAICQNSNPITSGAWQSFCLGTTLTGGGVISVQNYGTASPEPLTALINGTKYQFPFTLSGIVGPSTTIVGDSSTWNNNVGTLLADSGWGAAQHLGVRIQRSQASYIGQNAVWQSYDQNDRYLTACNTNAQDCINASINAAFPYALGTTALGYDFTLIGGDDPALGRGTNFGGGPTSLNAIFSFPPMQGSKIRVGPISSNGVTFDSCEICSIDFSGAQVGAVDIKPTNPLPLDTGVGFAPAAIHVTTVLAPSRLDLSGNVNAFIQFTDVKFDELNADQNSGGLTSGCAFQEDSPTSSQNMSYNTISIGFLHQIGSGSTGYCQGTGTPGAILGRDVFNLNIQALGGTTNGVDLWGSGNAGFIRFSGFDTGFSLKMESGACQQNLILVSDQTSPIIIDDSGCTGSGANILIGLGQITIGGNIVPQQTSTAGAGQFAYWSATHILTNAADVIHDPAGAVVGFGVPSGGPAGNVIFYDANSAFHIIAQVSTLGASYAWNWPTTAGTAGDALLSGGGSNPMTWSSGPVATITATTWTPAITASSTAGTPAYTFQVGSYEQIGRQVTARFVLLLSGWSGTPAGNVTITGLPVASANVANDLGDCFVSFFIGASITSSISGYVAPNSTTITLVYVGSNTTSDLTTTQTGTTPELVGLCNYHT